MIRMTPRRLATVALAAAMFSLPLAALAQTEGAAQPSLYERLGGLAPISVVVNDFIDALVPDAQINANPAVDAARKRVPASYLKFHVTSMVCQATGGPCQYAGRSMKDSHAHLHITAKEWDRMVVVLVQILDRYGVPQAEQKELLAIVDSTKADIVVHP
jgi:hemoglobin